MPAVLFVANLQYLRYRELRGQRLVQTNMSRRTEVELLRLAEYITGLAKTTSTVAHSNRSIVIRAPYVSNYFPTPIIIYPIYIFHPLGATIVTLRQDLVSWTFVNALLTLESSGDLGPNRVVERPHILYNDDTSTYVMWMHIDDSSYGEAKAGVATSSTVCGDYTYL